MTDLHNQAEITNLKQKITRLVAVVLVSVLGISIWTGISEYSSLLADAERRAAGFAQALGEHAETVFAETDRVVRDVIHEIDMHGGTAALSDRDLYDLLQNVGGSSPQIGSIFLTDRTGIMFTNSHRYPSKPINVADREYFRHYVENPDADFLLSRPVMSRLVNRWRFNLIRKRMRGGNQFDGLVVAAIEVSYFGRFLGPTSIGRSGRIMLIRDDGMPLVCEPHAAKTYDTDFGASELFRKWLPAAASGTFRVDRSIVDGADRIVSYKRLERYPVVAVISLGRDEVLEPWGRKIMLQGSLTVALCIIIVLLARLMFRHLDRLTDVQQHLSLQQEQLKVKAAQIDAANDAILQIDLEGRIVHFNQALCDMTGFSRAALEGRMIEEIGSVVDHDGRGGRFDQVRELEETTFDATFVSRTGSGVPVEVHARRVESEGKTFMLCIARNVAERKKAELREQGRLKILEEVATGATLEAILDRIILFIEQQLPGALGSVLLVDETGTRLVDGAAPSLPVFYRTAATNVRIAHGAGSCGTAAFLKQRVVVEDMETHPFWKGFAPAREAGLKSSWSQPILSPDRDILGTFAIYYRETRLPAALEIELIESAAHLASIAIAREVEEKRRLRLEDQLRHMQRIEAIGQLTGGIAHDFNNLLTPILMCSNLLKVSVDRESPAFAHAERIVRAAEKAADLTGKLLSFGRRQMLHMQPLDLNEIIAAFQDILHRTIRENIVIETRLTPQKAVVSADRGQIEQILLNFALNAQDAINDNGRIVIETGHVLLDDEYVRQHPGTQPGNYVFLAFSDDGCGIDAKTLPHIFEPFFTTREAGHGTGLGLATVYGSVRQHNGSISVESRVGSGTTFTVYLPAVDAEVHPKDVRKSEAAAAAAATASVLVVEDNAMVRDMIADILERAGYTVEVAEHPEEVLRREEALLAGIDLLVTDIVMPGMNGPELYEHLQKRRPALPVLFISGYATQMDGHSGMLNETNFLQKPFSNDVLMDRIAALLWRHSGAGGHASMDESSPFATAMA